MDGVTLKSLTPSLNCGLSLYNTKSETLLLFLVSKYMYQATFRVGLLQILNFTAPLSQSSLLEESRELGI